VIGSGATAVTLVPAIAGTAQHVTMLQRSPSYYFSVPSSDPLTRALTHVLPRRWAFAMARRRNLLLSHWLYVALRRWPHRMRKLLLSQVEKALDGKADMRHFTPSYMPWDQRLCIVPDADLFSAIKSGKASVATDQISGFEGKSVLLRSGEKLEADILVTATGLQLLSLGGMQVNVDGKPYLPQQHMLYKGVLLEGLPNFAWIIGYTNASWTLKADLATSYIVRLLTHLDAKGYGVAVPRDREGCQVDASILDNLNSGYIRRAGARVPRQGSKAPWRVTHHYPSDRVMLLSEPIEDGVLEFEPRRADPAPEAGRVSKALPA
jgi:monooxygenase